MIYKRIWYDRNNNNIHMWYADDEGKHRYVKEKPQIEYYIQDKTGMSPLKDIYGNSMKLQTSKDLYALRDFRKISKAKTCEASISEDIKYLHKKFGKSTFDVEIDHFQVATIDIECAAKKFPKPELAEYPINLISIHLSKENQMYTFGLHPYNGDSDLVKNYRYFADEKTMLESFLKFFRAKKVDVLTGWNASLFDVPYIINRCNKLDIDDNKFSMSPVFKYIEKKTKRQKSVVSGGYEVCGLNILDGLDLYKKFEQKKRVSYSLENIGMLEVGEGKKKYKGSINTIYETDWDSFVEYNIQDVLLTKKINDKKKYIELAIRFCSGAMIPYDKVYSSIAVITGYILKFLHDRNLVYSDPPEVSKVPYPGGFVMAKQGFYKYLLSFDFESLYPTIMIMSNICPSTLVLDPSDEEYDFLIHTPASERYVCETEKWGTLEFSGIHYRKDIKGIIPAIVQQFFNERKYWKNLGKCADGLKDGLGIDKIAENYHFDVKTATQYVKDVQEGGFSSGFCDVQQYVRKILINSIYGISGSKFFGFYNPNNAAAVTIWGRTIIQYVSAETNEYVKTTWHTLGKELLLRHGYTVGAVKPVEEDVITLTDTDSSFVHMHPMLKAFGMGKISNDGFRVLADIVSEEYFAPMFKKSLTKFLNGYNVDDNIMNFKQEKTISQMFVVAQKKYATEVIAKEGKIFKKPEVHVTGIEVVRTSTPAFFTPKIKEALRILFENNNKNVMLDYIRKVKEEYMEQAVDVIATPSTVNDYTEWVINKGRIDIVKCVKDKTVPKSPLHCPQHIKSGILFNYLVERYGWMEAPVDDNTKIKYIYVDPKNELKTNIIGFTGDWTPELDAMFKIDWELQFYKKFVKIIERFFDVQGWGKINLNQNDLEDSLEF